MGSNHTWGIIKKDEEENCESDMEYSSSSAAAAAADESTDDTSSSSSSDSNSCGGGGPLFQLAELMSQLPIKRGLSKYYHGKSQTFGSLASVESVEDLGKKDRQTTSYSRRMKSSSSSSCKTSSSGYGGNLFNNNNNNNNNRRKLLFCPKATIAKRSSATITPKTPFSPSLSAKPASSTLMLVS